MSFSRNVNRESVTYPSFKLEEFQAGGVSIHRNSLAEFAK